MVTTSNHPVLFSFSTNNTASFTWQESPCVVGTLVSIGVGNVQVIGGHHITDTVLPLMLLPMGTSNLSFFLRNAATNKAALLSSMGIRDIALVGEVGEAIHVLE